MTDPEGVDPQYYKEAIGNIGYAKSILRAEKPYSYIAFNIQYPESHLQAADPTKSHILGKRVPLGIDVRAARETADKLLYPTRATEATEWAEREHQERAARLSATHDAWRGAGEPSRWVPFNDPNSLTASEYYGKRLTANQFQFAVTELNAHKQVNSQGYQFNWQEVDRQAKEAINTYSKDAAKQGVSEITRSAVTEYMMNIHYRNIQDASPNNAGSIEPRNIANKKARALTSVGLLRQAVTPASMEDLILTDLSRLQEEMKAESDVTIKNNVIALRLNTTYRAAQALGLTK